MDQNGIHELDQNDIKIDNKVRVHIENIDEDIKLFASF